MNKKLEYDNYIFDLYGTLIDLSTDEHAAKTWKKWLRWLDNHEIVHPHYIEFRREFFEKDREYRQVMLNEYPYKYPEIDIIDVYRELFLKYTGRVINEDLLNEASYAFRECSRKYYRLFPGVEEFLMKIRESGKHAYILSNAQASYTAPEIKYFGLDKMVDDVLMSSDYKCMKPEKAFFEALIKKHDLNPERSVMIGDSLASDVKGAEGCGINTIHLIGENNPNSFYLSYIP